MINYSYEIPPDEDLELLQFWVLAKTHFLDGSLLLTCGHKLSNSIPFTQPTLSLQICAILKTQNKLLSYL